MLVFKIKYDLIHLCNKECLLHLNKQRNVYFCCCDLQDNGVEALLITRLLWFIKSITGTAMTPVFDIKPHVNPTSNNAENLHLFENFLQFRRLPIALPHVTFRSTIFFLQNNQIISKWKHGFVNCGMTTRLKRSKWLSFLQWNQQFVSLTSCPSA